MGDLDLPDRLMWRRSPPPTLKPGHPIQERESLMTTLQELSDGLAAAVEAPGPGVVEVRARRGRSATGIVWDKEHVLPSSHSIENDDEDTGVYGGKEAEGSDLGRGPWQ